MFSKHSRLALSSSWLLAAASMVAMCGPAAAAEFKYDPGDNVQFTYCHSHPPVLGIKPGDSVVTSTRDASNDVYSTGDKTLFPKLDLSKVNPQTGPFFIEGAEPGDTLVVHIDKIDFNRDWGWGGSIPYFGALDLPNSKIGRVEVPLRPFFGTIGTAPGGKECISSLVPGQHGANMDFNETIEGVTMYFPVNERGALFMLGDGHAA